MKHHKTKSPTHTPPKNNTDASPPPSHEAIAERAYTIYEKAGCTDGHCGENWQQAELEMQSEALSLVEPRTVPGSTASGLPSE
ncbi:MAG: DUF2934 domain-containing protein [Candidatus Sumerlaeia bacterium]|nr:DUF2934 domain-containing protein [Candidatus Sumerlaeia bacterium]